MVIGSLIRTVLKEEVDVNESLNKKIISAFKDKDFDYLIYTINHRVYSTLFKELEHSSNSRVLPIIMEYIDQQYRKYPNNEWLEEQLGVLDKLKELLEWRTTDSGDSLFNDCIRNIDGYLNKYSRVAQPTKIYGID